MCLLDSTHCSEREEVIISLDCGSVSVLSVGALDLRGLAEASKTDGHEQQAWEQLHIGPGYWDPFGVLSVDSIVLTLIGPGGAHSGEPVYQRCTTRRLLFFQSGGVRVTK